MKALKKVIIFVFLTVFIAAGLLYSAQESVQISLVYPQQFNKPKRQAGKTEKPPALKGKVFIDVIGINPEQAKSPNSYVEYFLDDELIYSTQNRKESLPDAGSLGFILNTRLYPDGEHKIVVNLWDKDGPSAIGIRKIIIQNAPLNEN